MFKYILKRIGISLIILFGVSIIIYTLVRMMPNDYIDNKYSSQLSQGTITQDDIDRFKSLYGLAVPESYTSVGVKSNVKSEDEQYSLGGSYTRNTKQNAHDNAVLLGRTDEDTLYTFVAGTYRSKKYRLVLEKPTEIREGSGIYVRTAHFYKGKDRKTGVTEEQAILTGTYSAEVDSKGNIVISVSVDGNVISSGTSYRLATGWEKFSSVLGGYFTWIGKLFKGDLGESFLYKKPVARVIGDNMWVSFAIALIATILQFLIAIPLGISSATHQYSVRDYTVTVFTMIGISLPTYFFAAIAIKAFAVDIPIFPSSGLISPTANYTKDFAGFMQKFGDILHHLALPIFVNVILSIGGLMRYTRTNTLEVLNSDYIRTARAKGLSEKTVIYKHAFRNTMIPLATLLAGILPSLFGGMMITEEVFAIDGIGRLAYQALRQADVPFVMGYNMFLAILTVIGTLFSDIMYSVVDPRVKLGG